MSDIQHRSGVNKSLKLDKIQYLPQNGTDKTQTHGGLQENKSHILYIATQPTAQTVNPN